MTQAVGVQQLEDVSARLAHLGRECEERTRAVVWRCARGRRAVHAAADFSRLAGALAADTSHACVLLYRAWSERTTS
ncbi:MAG TPA: hypothetical protein VHU91_01520 [Mycobacteriales bacterium]|nr:hypothetical protein [Mycobacteriales bacterium]